MNKFGQSIFNQPKYEKIVVLDVETPNRHNDSICQIGLLQIANGAIINQVCELINPQDSFDQRNMDIHGISPEMVRNADPINVFWKHYEDWFNHAIVVGQNIKYDVCVLTKALKKYDIGLPEMTTLCTMCMAKKYLTLDKYNLESLCGYYDISIGNAHDAGDDAKASWKVLEMLNQQFGITTSDLEVYKYDISGQRASDKRNISYAQDTQAAQELKYIVEDIMEDGVIEEREVLQLKHWLDNSEILMGYYPYDKICETIYNILEDGHISLLEYEELNKLFKEFIDPVACQDNTEKIVFEGKIFCLTGNFDYGDKSTIESLIVQKGGMCNKGVSAKVNYLVVGGSGSDAWKFGNYGGKVQKALELQDKGKEIIIVSEQDFLESLG